MVHKLIDGSQTEEKDAQQLYVSEDLLAKEAGQKAESDAPVAVDVAEQQIAALLDPDRAFRGAGGTAKARGQFIPLRPGWDDAVHSLGNDFDGHGI
ncbi:hypothetical protein B4Q13_20765, partial [Lacticaseibacillus rhamnosus]